MSVVVRGNLNLGHAAPAHALRIRRDKRHAVGFALKKGEPRFKEAINKALLDVEASGDAVKIFDAWFGPKSPEPMARKFKIQAD